MLFRLSELVHGLKNKMHDDYPELTREAVYRLR